MIATLSVQGISAGYGNVGILNDVSIDVSGTEALAVLGPNGSGKSTLAKTVMGFTDVHKGRIEWNGADMTHHAPWRRAANLGLGYMPQSANVFPTLDVEENLMLAAGRKRRGALRDELSRIYEMFSVLAQRRHVSAGKLSGGERRLVALAAVLLQRPRLLILDEPTSDLAPATIDLVFDKIREIRDTLRVPMILVEQNVSRALELADRVCIIRRGQVVLDKPSAEISEKYIADIFLEHI